MERTQKVNKNWESYSDDEELSSLNSSDEQDQDGDGADGQPRMPMLKRAMAEDKLQEKRLKERARRNGMASSIDEMRILVPELIEAKKNYSQAKVVAFALAHMQDLQRENDAFRQRLGMPTRMEEFRARVKTNGKTKKERAPSGERGRKRRRLLSNTNGGEEMSLVAEAVTVPMSMAAVPSLAAPTAIAPMAMTPIAAPSPLVAAPAIAAAISAAQPRPLASSTPTPRSLSSSSGETSEHEQGHDLELDMDSFVVDSLAASPALSPHAIDDELGPFALQGNFDNFDTHPRPHAMDWEGHDSDLDMFHQPQHPHTDYFTLAAHKNASAPNPNSHSNSMQFESFFVDHVLNNNASLH